MWREGKDVFFWGGKKEKRKFLVVTERPRKRDVDMKDMGREGGIFEF